MSARSPTEGVGETRSAVLRRRHRRVFRWSLGIAVLAHALLLFFGPRFRGDPLPAAGTELVGGVTTSGGIAVDVFFGPPTIVDGTGALAREPPSRVLRASRRLPPPPVCARHDWFAREFAEGEVRLTVLESGRPDTVQLTQSTGDRCWDAVVTGLASDLRYRWLPSERFPAPVRLHQPVTVSLTGY